MSQSLSSAFEYQPRHSYPYWRQLDPSAHAGGQETHSRAQIMNHHEKPCQLFTTLAKAEQLEVSGDENSNIGSRGVAKRGRGAKMWISEDALRRKLERRKHFASSIQAAVKDTALQPVISPRSETLSPSMAYITVEDIQFQVTNGGRKLLRITGRLIPLWCPHSTRSDHDRYLHSCESHTKRSNSQWSDLQAN